MASCMIDPDFHSPFFMANQEVCGASYSTSSNGTSPLYSPESWERAGEPELGYRGEHFYHNSPRISRQKSWSEPAKKYHACIDSCKETCISLKEKCALCKVLCCLNCRRFGNCQLQKMYRQYFFFSKSLVLVLIFNILFSTAVFGVTTEVVKVIIGPEYLLLRTLLIHGVTQLMFPISGHIADLYIGRHNVIRFSLWVAWIGLALLGLAFAFDGYDNKLHPLTQYAVFPITAVLLSVSYVCFMANIIPFGLDQLQGASHIHYSSFFYWWYWTLNIGFITIPQYCSDKVEIDILIQAEIGLVCVTITIILDVLLKHWFVIEPICKKTNPLLQIVTILKDACRVSKARAQYIPSMVFHEVNIQKFSRMERIKKRYGGKYETEEVEDVKTFFRVILVLIGVGFSTLVYAGVFDTIGLMASNMSGSLVSFVINTELCVVDISILNATNALILTMLIPVLDLLIVPLLRHTFFSVSILCRLGIGSFIALVGVTAMFVIHFFGNLSSRLCIFQESPFHLEVDVYYIFIPVVILTVAEVFIYIPGFEFICAQAPYNMRGLLIGVFFSVQGIFSIVAVVLQSLFMTSQYTFPSLSCGGWYYITLVGLSAFGFVVYVIVSCTYKHRKRDDVCNHVTLIEEHYASFLARREQT